MPAAIPETMPVEEPTVATPVAPELHMPLAAASVNVTFPPTHTLPGPLIAAGVPLTVIMVNRSFMPHMLYAA